MGLRHIRLRTRYAGILALLGLCLYCRNLFHALFVVDSGAHASHLPSTTPVLHGEDIEQMLEVAARDAHPDFHSLLATLRRASDADPPQCRPSVRFVLLVIYISPEFPLYTNHFLSTVKRNPSIDLLLYASANNCLEMKHRHEQTNVHIHCAHPNNIYFLIADGLCSQWECSAGDFHRIFVYLKTIIGRFSYRLAHMKPMLGSIFRRYISCYSHWAFGDIDLWYGDFDKLYPTALARQYDVVTFADFPFDRLFIQGQLAVFKNDAQLTSLWAQIKQVSSVAAFALTMKDESWLKFTFTEGEFSTIIMDHGNITWIRIPGLHVSDHELYKCKTVVYVTAGTPPSLTVERATEMQSRQEHTTFNETSFNATVTPLLQQSACKKQGWMRASQRRCISNVKNQSDSYGIIVMREPEHKQFVSSMMTLGTKEYLMLHLHFSKRSYNWTTIPLEGAFELFTAELATKSRIMSSFNEPYKRRSVGSKSLLRGRHANPFWDEDGRATWMRKKKTPASANVTKSLT